MVLHGNVDHKQGDIYSFMTESGGYEATLKRFFIGAQETAPALSTTQMTFLSSLIISSRWPTTTPFLHLNITTPPRQSTRVLHLLAVSHSSQNQTLYS
jgi:hypothetical protein